MKYTTREDFPKTLPERKTFFCWNCRSINVIKENANDGKVSYLCNDCHVSSPRVLIYDKNMQQHFDDKNRLIHESCGILLTNTKGEIVDIISGVIRGETCPQDKLDEIIRKIKLALGGA